MLLALAVISLTLGYLGLPRQWEPVVTISLAFVASLWFGRRLLRRDS